MSRDSDKLDLILEKLKSFDTLEKKIDNLDSKFNDLSTTVNTLNTTVASHTSEIAEIRAELAKNKEDIRSLKVSHNNREQRLRACTLRLFNFPTAPGESVDNYKPLAAKVYDRIIRPALSAAKGAGDIGTLPQQQNAMEACFRVFSPQGPVPPTTSPPVIIRLVSMAVKTAVMKHRRAVPLPSEGERAVGIRRFVLVEDLTPDTHSLLKALQADSRTEKAWSVNGNIMFTRPGVVGVKKVRSVFDSLDTILS